ncbi:MAG: class I SAM-dependent methyltransferase [Proteobacteria bacterium]|nr:class I SAM-dependent methyltransferase [Pseudomonadota bacterium]
MPSLEYHLRELQAVLDPFDPVRAVPKYPCAGWKVLDVGCGIGQTLLAPELRAAAELHGIDTDGAAIEFGRRRAGSAHLTLTCAQAEHIPYEDGSFDLVYSRVAVPYTNVPLALAEMRRVLKTGGRFWATLQPVRGELSRLGTGLQRLAAKTVIDSGYVLANSLMLAMSGRCVPRPWNGKYDTVQTRRGAAWLLRRSGFRDVEIFLSPLHFIATATRS